MFKKKYLFLILTLTFIVGLVFGLLSFNQKPPIAKPAQTQLSCTHYVSPQGNDSNSGRSLNQP